MDLAKQSMLSLAIAGTLTASQFTKNIEEYLPKNSLQNLNIEKENLRKSKKYIKLSEAQLEDQKRNLDIMLDVNNRTFEDLFPAFEISLQKWLKEDEESVHSILDLVQLALDTRIKQYNNLKSAFKNSNIPKEYFTQIDEMRDLSNEAKRKIKDFKNKVAILIEAKELFKSLEAPNNIRLIDYWLPSIEDTDNIMIVSVDGLSENDFEQISEIEDQLNKNLLSNTINIISIG